MAPEKDYLSVSTHALITTIHTCNDVDVLGRALAEGGYKEKGSEISDT
jgi:hypothetical protein